MIKNSTVSHGREKHHSPVIALIGPTAVGKTSLSLSIAEKFGCEIISVDSMQIYRHMDIGTAKASAEERQRIPHHLIDIVNPDQEYNVACFVDDVEGAYEKIISRGKIPLLTGGTGLYLKALFEGLSDLQDVDVSVRQDLRMRLESEGRRKLYDHLLQCDPETARRIHPNDTYRLLRALEIYEATGVPWSIQKKGPANKPLLASGCKIGLTSERDVLYKRINERVEQMIHNGLLGEVQNLLQMGYDRNLNSMQSIGYRHMIHFLEGSWNWDDAVRLLARDTRRYAKRQFTWFHQDTAIRWFGAEQEKEIYEAIGLYLDNVYASG